MSLSLAQNEKCEITGEASAAEAVQCFGCCVLEAAGVFIVYEFFNVAPHSLTDLSKRFSAPLVTLSVVRCS